MSKDEPLLSAHDLHCERDERILFSGLSFSLRPGQILQVAGANGSGKTTLLRMVCGLFDGYQGEIRRRAADWESFLGSMLYIGHRPAVNAALTPLENLRWCCRLQAPTGAKTTADTPTEADLIDALQAAGLEGYEDSQCHGLSAGQRQRASLARLALSSARLWILDEPFTTLDGPGIRWLQGLLQGQRQRGGAVMVTSHHPLDLPDLSSLHLSP